VSLRRKKTFVVYREAKKVGAYDERPMLPDDAHVQLCLSRNDHPQPFYLVCEKDTMLVVFAGRGRLAFKDTGVLYFPLEPGDHVYIPAGAPSRIVPEPGSELIVLRYKAQVPGLEGVAWYCDSCGAQLHRHVFDTARTVPQAGYLAGARAFNADASLRSCTCGSHHPALDLGRYRWEQLAAALTA
jgi:mannose-6-phosphate isomerase-like protein (cupin superfamily)